MLREWVEWLVQQFAFSIGPTACVLVDATLLEKLSSASRYEVAALLRSIEAIDRAAVLQVLRTAWEADRTIPRPVVQKAETPSLRAIDSLALDFGTRATRTLGTGALRGSTVADVFVIGEARVAARLFELLIHPRPSLRQGASELCAVLTEKRHLSAFAPLVESEFPECRQAALRTITQIGGEEWLPHIISGLKHPNVGVRLSAVTAVVRLHPEGASELLLRAADDECPEVKVAALTAFGALGEVAAIPTLLGFLSHRTVFQRVGAARGLAKLASSGPAIDYQPVMIGLQQRLLGARRGEDILLADIETAFDILSRNLSPQVLDPANSAPVLIHSEVEELETALRIVAKVAGVDPLTMIPVSTLPIPSTPHVPVSHSLPIADAAPSGSTVTD